uniref:Uncharacterized protein n=1 Tax=Clytia hemisphaerica TaxID=252671 RepID=A0A7M5X0E9_9CNID
TEINSKPETLYFNFDNKDAYFQHFLHVQLGTRYNFTTTALPNGGSSTMITLSPTVCELEVIEAIYYKIQKKEIFDGCTSPDYVSRKAIAGEICKLFPDNPLARMAYTKNNLIEVGCKFKLKHSNDTKQTARL